MTNKGGVATCDGAVLELSGVEVGKNVSVGGTATVVTREEGAELSDTVGVGYLDTTEESGVDVGWVSETGTVIGGGDTRVDTSGVAVPVTSN